MSIVCDLAIQSSQAFNQSSRGVVASVASNVASAINALGAADVGIRLGSGGQVGLLDLPRIITEERGIECYTPERGSIYVTPLQWYANGMSCNGLRDPDREALEQRIRELEERARNRNRIFPGNERILEDLLRDENLSREQREALESQRAGFRGGDQIEFLKPGILKNDWFVTIFDQDSIYNSRQVTTFFPVVAGNILLFEIGRFPAIIYWGSKLVRNISVYNSWSLGERWSVNNIFLNIYDGVSINNGEYGTNVTSRGLRRTQTGSVVFIPDNPAPPLTAPPPPPAINYFPPNFEPIDPCDIMCGCQQIQQIVNGQRNLNANIERLIREIHRATAAGLFASGSYRLQPEQKIEQLGKQLYSANPGRGGATQVSNLMDAFSALIAAEYHRLGLHKFPANVPKNLIPEPNQVAEALDRDFIDLHTLADYLEWNTKIDDERFGEWPVVFEVTDDNQRKKAHLWNLAEAMGDIYGALIKVVEDSDIGVQWGIRSSVEASKAGNAALKALHLLKELVEFSGALTGPNFIKVDSTFTPNPLEAQSQEDMLKPSSQDLEVTDIVDKRTLLGLLLNISYWSQISGRSVFNDLKNNPATGRPDMPGDAIKQMRRQSRVFNKNWDEWRRKRQQRRNIPLGDRPPGTDNPPDIKDIPTQT